MSGTAVIVDVDGTLCDVTSVLHHLNGETHGFRPNGKPVKNFDAFHKASALCPPNQVALDYCATAVKAGHDLIIVTARMYQWRALTVAWLEEHLMPVLGEQLYRDRVFGPHMRAQGDYRVDVDVKSEILAKLRKNWRIVGAIDDNPHIVELWEAEGIPTVVVPRPANDNSLEVPR